jgi:paraquat-inducible protein B
MSKKANPTLLGVFIVLGLALGVAGLLVFSSARLFTPTQTCVLYFNASLKGLNPGAPVKYRGVTIGAVRDVLIRFRQVDGDRAMPVIIELREDLVRQRMDEDFLLGGGEKVAAIIQRGLRGSLEAESLVTGLLFVQLDVLPEAPPPVFHQQQPVYLEIPTVPTRAQELLENVASLDLKGLEDRLRSLLDRLDTALGEIRFGAISAGLTNVLASLQNVLGSPHLTNTLAEAHQTLRQYRTLGEKLNGRVDPLADGATNTLHQAGQTLAQFRAAAQELRDLLAPGAPLRHDLSLVLDQVAGAAQSLSALIEFLQRNPNALLTGRKPRENKPNP